MKIHIVLDNSSEIEITWKLPYFPNIDHEMKLIDFIGQTDSLELKDKQDVFVVKKIVWVNETSVKAKIFVECSNN